MKEESNNNKSIDNIRRRKKRIFTDENDQNNMNNTQEEMDITNINRTLNSQNLDNFPNIENILDDNKNEHNNQKKKVEKKVNRNLKLLKIIKERMKEQKYKSLFEEEKNKNKNIEIEEYLDNNNKQDNTITKEKEEEKEKEKEKDKDQNYKDKETNTIEEEKKNILLKILNSKKYNKYQRNDNKKDIGQLTHKNKGKTDNKVLLNPLLIDSLLNDNQTESVEEKEDPKKDKELLKNKLNDKRNINNTRNSLKEKFNSLNNKEKKNKSFSITDPMKILELLKSKKREESINKLKKENESTNKKGEVKNINKTINSYGYKPKRNISEKLKNNEITKSLPKNIFRDKEDEDNNKNKTQTPIYNLITDVNNNNNNKIKKYYNLGNKKLINRSYNNNINNNNSFQNVKINKINYNPININNNLKEKLKSINTLNNKKNNNTSARITNYKTSNIFNNNNLKSDNNNVKDIKDSKKKLSFKKIVNKTLMNTEVYNPIRISNNNSPQRHKLNQIERNNTINPENVLNDINKNFRNLSKIPKPSKYIKKSTDKYNKRNNNIPYSNTIDNDRDIYNNKSKKLINNYKDNFNSSYNVIGYHPKNKLSVIEPTSAIDTTNEDIKGSSNYPNTKINNYFKKSKNTVSRKKQNNNFMMFNLEDLMILEERLNDITIALESNENIENKCFNFWNYYYNCSLYNLLEKIFTNKEDSNIVRLSINYELMSIMVCYEYAFENEPTEDEKEIFLYLIELIDINHDNLIIICEYILTKIIPENKQNIWVLKLQEIIRISKLSKNNKNEQKNYSQSPLEKITNNINLIIKSLKNILLFQTTNRDILFNFLKTIDNKTYEEINNFFREFIIRVNNFEGSIIASSYLKKKKYFKPIQAPYLDSPPSKPNTLILDLDETLIHFKIKSSRGGTLRARPYLFGFLEEMGHYYELVIWTSATEAYANSLIDAIEYEKKYFDYILYREHATIIGDDFVKDLTRIGRGLDRVIIIDDMPQNFRLQKDNGITIKPFFGDDYDDSALYDLVPILKHIAEDRQDVRIGLRRYKEEIIKKVTSNISKQDI